MSTIFSLLMNHKLATFIVISYLGLFLTIKYLDYRVEFLKSTVSVLELQVNTSKEVINLLESKAKQDVEIHNETEEIIQDIIISEEEDIPMSSVMRHAIDSLHRNKNSKH